MCLHLDALPRSATLCYSSYFPERMPASTVCAGKTAPSRHSTAAVSVSSTRKDFSHASTYRYRIIAGRRFQLPRRGHSEILAVQTSFTTVFTVPYTPSPSPMQNVQSSRVPFSPQIAFTCTHRWAEAGRPAGRCPNTWDKRYISAASARLCLVHSCMSFSYASYAS